MALAESRPETVDWTAVGLPLIIAWFGTFIVNIVLAQATFQMALSCRTPAEGRRGLLYAALMGVPFIVLGVVFGMSAALTVPDVELGLVAVPLYLSQVLPAPLVGVFFLGVWACTLGWGAPCQFSGATSLGRDVGQAFNPRASDQDLIRYTRWGLVAMTGLMIVFGALRAEQSAWWNILAWTLRNGATFAPVVGLLLWPLATRRAAQTALIVGFLTGLSWYHLGGWAVDSFFLGVHPVWVGMSVNLFTMVAVTVVEKANLLRFGSPNPTTQRIGMVCAAAAVLVVVGTVVLWEDLHRLGLTGLVGFTAVLSVSLAAFMLTRAAEYPPAGRVDSSPPHAGETDAREESAPLREVR